MALEELVSKAISDYAGTAVRVGGLEEAVRDLKTQLTEALKGINESLRGNVAILEKLNFNMEEHKNIHIRIDNVEEDFSDHRADYRALSERVDDLERGCLRASHIEANKRMEAIEERLEIYDRDYSFIHSNIGSWAIGILIAMTTMGFVVDMVTHYDLLKKILFK